MDVSATTWQTLSKLLDEALDMEPAARAAWLEQLTSAEPEIAPALRKLLAAHASSETADVMAQLPALSVRFDAARVTALAPGDRVGPYRLKRELGTGGMADVWLAERADGAFAREVALKLPMLSRLRRDLAQRFVRERDILARLEHPNIARLYDAGVTDDGLSYLAMEYVDGQPITEYCDQHNLMIEARLKLFLHVLEAVQYAHANLIIHRDLKPSNVLVAQDGQVRLLDFGIAKLLAVDDTARETQLTQMAGRALTPDYASPEQIKGEPLTIATDIYSLGVVLYELLVGQRPYRLKVKSAAQLEQAIIATEPTKPSSAVTVGAAECRGTASRRLSRMLGGDLDTIVLKALSKSPADRYSTIAAFADDLCRARDGRPVSARPASLPYRLKKFVARNKVAVGAGSTIAFVLIAAAAISIWQARVARDQALLAQREAKRAQAVQRFLLDLFRANTDAQPDPVRARETTARELLDTGASRVRTQLGDVPEVLDEVLATLSDMYRALDLAAKEADMERQRVEVRRSVYGRDDPRVAEVLINQAHALQTSAEMQKVPALLAEAKAIVDSNPKTPAIIRAKLLSGLARADMYTNGTRMRRYAHESVQQLQAINAAPEVLANALRLDALANFFLGHWSSAVELHEKALVELRRNDLQPFNLAVTVMVELADAHALRGDIPTAERLFRELIAESRRRNGETHGITVHIESRLLGLLHGTARREESRQMRDLMLRNLERSESKADIGLANSVRRNSAATLLSEGQFSAAASPARQAADESRRYMPHSIVLGSRLLVHGQLLTEIGRYADAALTLDEAASTHASALGPDAHPVVESRFVLAQARLAIASGRPHDAIEPLRKLVAAPIPTNAVVPVDQLRAQVVLAAAYLESGQISSAIESARLALDRIERSPMRDFYQIIEADAALQLGQAQLRAADAISARPLLERSLRLRIRNDHAVSPWIAQSQIALAECLVALGDQKQARALADRAAGIHSQHDELGDHYRRPLMQIQKRLLSAATKGAPQIRA